MGGSKPAPFLNGMLQNVVIVWRIIQRVGWEEKRTHNLLPTPIDILGYVLSWTHISLCTVKMLVVENSNSPNTCNMFFFCLLYGL